MIPYIGGESYLASWIISNFPKNYLEKHYCEVFGGGGWVLFKKEPSYLETYNDLNSNLVNLFRVIRDNYKEFQHLAQWTLHSREMYAKAVEALKDEKQLTEIERAVNYAIWKTQTFSAQNGNSWAYCINVKKVYSGRFMPFIKRLSLINARLKKVQIERLDFERLVDKYDSKNTLFYLDPPYVGVEYYYNNNGVNFTYEDHKRLAKLLKKIKGKFVLSYYEHDLINELYGKRFRRVTKNTVKHSAAFTKLTKIKEKPKSVELLIMNY